jgi:hypothetical protein
MQHSQVLVDQVTSDGIKNSVIKLNAAIQGIDKNDTMNFVQ